MKTEKYIKFAPLPLRVLFASIQYVSYDPNSTHFSIQIYEDNSFCV